MSYEKYMPDLPASQAPDSSGAFIGWLNTEGLFNIKSFNMNMNMNMNTTAARHAAAGAGTRGFNINIMPGGGRFRGRYWDKNVELYIELPRFFAPGPDGGFEWQNFDLPQVPGFDETMVETEALLRMQADKEQRALRREDIERENMGELPYFGRVLVSNPLAYPETYKIMNVMMLIGSIAAMHYKNRFNRPRPSQLEPRLRPMIEVPGHPAYPSGHATQAHLIAIALDTIVQDLRAGEEMHRIADAIAVNREWAGVHYASDSACGQRLARLLFPFVADAYDATFLAAIDEWR